MATVRSFRNHQHHEPRVGERKASNEYVKSLQKKINPNTASKSALFRGVALNISSFS